VIESLYIHIPFCISRCAYCDFYSNVCKTGVIPENYISALCNEIEYRIKNNNLISLKTVYIGGGTPSLLSINQIRQIFSVINSNAKIEKDAEVTIEVNPDDITKEFLSGLNVTPVNRISCGIQSLNNESLAFCSRRADYNASINALELFAKYWNKALSLDLICGLPNDTEETFCQSLNKIISYKPEHISMYSLTIEEETPLGRKVENGEIEYDFDFADELWLKCKELLKSNGYNQYEVSNFCLNGNECKHNLKYWNHEDYLGCGSGATGTVYNNDGSGTRWTCSKNINEYTEFWNKKNSGVLPQIVEEITREDSKFEFFMMGLRKRSGIKESEYENIFQEKIPNHIEQNFIKWNKKGLVSIERNKNDIIYSMNEKGLLFLNTFLNEII